MNPPAPEDPKGIAGLAKPQLQLVPPVINTAMAAALKIGADKYGPWNWRTNKVEIMTYLGAMRRHIDAVLEGEDLDPESGAHHLGHVAAGCAIVLDALAHGTLIDNRPPVHHPFGDSARLSRETLDNIGAKLKKARRPAVMVDGQPTYEAHINPNLELAEYLAARQRMRDAMTPIDRGFAEAEEAFAAKLKEITGKDFRLPLTWGSLFESPLEKAFKESHERPINLDELEGPIKGKAKGYQRPILLADEQAPTNLDAIANHIDEVVNEFPTEPLDPHS